MSVDKWTVQQTVISLYQRILFSNQKEWTVDEGNNLDRSQGCYYAELNKKGQSQKPHTLWAHGFNIFEVTAL